MWTVKKVPPFKAPLDGKVEASILDLLTVFSSPSEDDRFKYDEDGEVEISIQWFLKFERDTGEVCYANVHRLFNRDPKTGVHQWRVNGDENATKMVRQFLEGL